MVMTQSTVFVPCKNIKIVTLGGYISTIFGYFLGEPLRIAYYGNI